MKVTFTSCNFWGHQAGEHAVQSGLFRRGDQVLIRAWPHQRPQNKGKDKKMSEAGLKLTEQFWFFLLEDIWQQEMYAEKIVQRCSQTFWRTSCLKIIWLEMAYNNQFSNYSKNCIKFISWTQSCLFTFVSVWYTDVYVLYQDCDHATKI